MNEKKRETILKIMSIMTMLLYVYPLTNIVRILLFEESINFLDGFFYVGTIFGTFIMVNLIMRKNYTRKNIILAYGTLVISLIASLIYFLPYGILPTMFGTSITIISCFFAVRVYFKRYNYLVSGVKIYVGVLLLLAALTFSTYFGELKHLKNKFYIFIFIYAFFLLIIKNQSNLDSIISKRFDKVSGLPERMRSYNIKKITVFFILIVGMYYFRDTLIIILRELRSLLMLILKTSWNFLGSIIKKIQEVFEVEEIALPSSPEGGYIADEGVNGNSIIRMIFNVVGIALVVFVVYKIGTVLIIHRLIPFLRDIFKRIFKKIINIFEDTECKEEKSDYYTDSIERILPSDTSKKKKKSKEVLSINKALRHVEKIKNPKGKIKYLYGFILKYMNVKGVEIKKSYSTGEIYKKAKESVQLDKPFREITSVYDRIKYGDKMPKVGQVDSTKDNTVKSIEIIKKNK